MNILTELNLEYQIIEENNIFYDMQAEPEKIIIAKSKADLIQFYIRSYEYKIECLFEDETKTKEHYKDTINQLKKII